MYSFSGPRALIASFLEAPGTYIYMTLTRTHSALKPPWAEVA